MVVCEGCADGLIDLEVAAGGVEAELGWAEWVLLGEDQNAVVVAALVVFTEAEQAEMEFQVVLAADAGEFDWVLQQLLFLTH